MPSSSDGPRRRFLDVRTSFKLLHSTHPPTRVAPKLHVHWTAIG